MTEASSQWTLSVLLGGPGWTILLIGLPIVVWWFLANSTDVRLSFRIVDVILTALVVLLGGILAFWPFISEYHQYRDVTGTVDKVSSRLVSAGDQGGSNQKFVVLIHGNGNPYGITDTRASLLHPGDTVHLRCKRVYEYGSDNAGYDCKWGR